MIVRPSCPPVRTPQPLRAKRCASSRALASSSRLGINTKVRSGLGLREHFFPRLFEQSALAPAQACQTAAGNLLEQWIYLLGDKLIGTHGAEPGRLDSAVTQHALNK